MLDGSSSASCRVGPCARVDPRAGASSAPLRPTRPPWRASRTRSSGPPPRASPRLSASDSGLYLSGTVALNPPGHARNPRRRPVLCACISPVRPAGARGMLRPGQADMALQKPAVKPSGRGESLRRGHIPSAAAIVAHARRGSPH